MAKGKKEDGFINYTCTGTQRGGGDSITFIIEAECIKEAYKAAGAKIYEVLGHQAIVEVREVEG